MSQPKKWVFTELVKDPDDPMELIAYAMYKADKDDHATQCRARQMNDTQLSAKLTDYHDSIAYSERRLNAYRDKATSAIDQLILEISAGVEHTFSQRIDALNAQHATEIASLQAQIAAAEEKAFQKWTHAAHQYSSNLVQDPKWLRGLKAFGLWLISGVPGLFATVLTTVVLVGVVSLFTTNALQTTKQALKDGLDAIMIDHGGIPQTKIEEPEASSDGKKP